MRTNFNVGFLLAKAIIVNLLRLSWLKGTGGLLTINKIMLSLCGLSLRYTPFMKNNKSTNLLSNHKLPKKMKI